MALFGKQHVKTLLKGIKAPESIQQLASVLMDGVWATPTYWPAGNGRTARVQLKGTFPDSGIVVIDVTLSSDFVIPEGLLALLKKECEVVDGVA